MPILFLIVFVDLLGFGVVIPLAPYYAEHFGAPPDVVTLLMTTFSLMQFLSAPVWGALSDRIGRKPVLAFSMLGAAASYAAAAFASELWMLFAARAFAGLMAGNIASAQAYVADTTGPESRARGMGLIGAAFGLGLIFGPVMGGVLGGPDAAHADFVTPFLAGAALSLLAAVLTFVLLRESWTPDRRALFQGRSAANRVAELAVALRRPLLGWLIGLFFLFTFVFAGMESTYALWAERALSWGPQQVGYVFSFAGLVAAAIQGGAVGPLARRFGEMRLIAAGALVLGLGFLVVTAADTAAGAIAGMGLFAAGISLANPALSSLISQKVPEHMQGGVLGVSQSASSLARIAGPAWAGAIFAALGPTGPYVSGAVLMAAALVLVLYLGAVRAEASPPK